MENKENFSNKRDKIMTTMVSLKEDDKKTRFMSCLKKMILV